MSVLSRRPDPLLPASDVMSGVPRGVAGVLHKALDLNADGRPASALAMRQMLRDNERYGYLAEPVTVATTTPGQRILAHETRSMPDETRADHLRQTEAKTEILPAFQSQVTSVAAATVPATNVARAQFTTAGAPKRRGFSIAAGAMALLLFGGAIAGGLYVVKPSVFGIHNETSDTGASLPAANANTAAADMSTVQNDANTAAVPGGDPTLSTTTESQRPAASGDRPEQTAKDRQQTERNRAAQTTTPSEQQTETNPSTQTVTVGRDGEAFRMNEPAQPPNVRNNPLPPGFNPRNLTPEQRRKLQRYLRNQPPANAIRPIPRGTP